VSPSIDSLFRSERPFPLLFFKKPATDNPAVCSISNRLRYFGGPPSPPDVVAPLVRVMRTPPLNLTPAQSFPSTSSDQWYKSFCFLFCFGFFHFLLFFGGVGGCSVGLLASGCVRPFLRVFHAGSSHTQVPRRRRWRRGPVFFIVNRGSSPEGRCSHYIYHRFPAIRLQGPSFRLDLRCLGSFYEKLYPQHFTLSAHTFDAYLSWRAFCATFLARMAAAPFIVSGVRFFLDRHALPDFSSRNVDAAVFRL